MIKMLTEVELEKVRTFLKRAKALYPTNQYTFKPSEKNKLFDRKYNLRNSDKLRIMQSLTEADCIEIRKNDNPRYPEADVFVFIKLVSLDFYGEPVETNLYIKDYITDDNGLEMVIVISFHEEGMHDSVMDNFFE